MRSLFFKNLAVVFISTFLFVGLLITPYSIVSAQSSRIDYTPKLNNLEPQDLSAPKYADNRIIVKFIKDQSPLVLQEKVDERAEQRSSLTGLLSQQITDIAYRIRGQELPEAQLEKLESFAQSQNVKGVSIFESLPETRETFVYEGISQKSIDVEEMVADFASLEEVVYAEPDYIGRLLMQPNDEFYGTQWNYPNIHADQAWDITKGDPNGSVLVAVLDSGITSDHPDLNSKIVAMYNCVNRNPCTANSGYDDNAYWDNGQYFEIYHGSHVSGTAAAVTNNGLGVSGTGYNTKLISIKVADSYGDIYSTELIRGLNVLVQSYSGSKIVINMSLGFTADAQSVHDAVQSAWNSGFVVVASAGNNGNSIPNYPAAYSEVISVAATDRNNAIAPYSNRGTWIDIAAPGGNCNSLANRQNCIMSTSKYNPLTGEHWYNYLAGTSMAAPHVSGAAALVWTKYPSFTNTQVRNAIQSSADQISGTGTYWRYGKLNAAAALAPPAATSTPTPTFTPVPTSTPTLTPTPSNSPTPTNTPTPTTTPTPTVTPTPTTAPVPDLIVESIRVIDSQTGPSGTYDIIATIKNQGNAAAGFHRNYLYLNPTDQPPILTTLDRSNGARNTNLPAGEQYEWGAIEIDFTEVDNVIYAWVDRDNGVVESNDNNNQLMITFNAPSPTPTTFPTNTPTPIDACPLFTSGDVSCDGLINSVDYAIWYTEYICAIDNGQNCMSGADFDSNGVVNLFDFTILISGIRQS